MLLVIACAAAAVWAAVLLLPWQPHLTRERLEPAPEPADLGDMAVLIPARNEARTLSPVLRALRHQGPGLEVWVVDDESTDGTGDLCERLAAELASVGAPEPLHASPLAARDAAKVRGGKADAERLAYALRIELLRGAALPAGWAGKLWALQQAYERIERRYILLLDADIELAPLMAPALLERAKSRGAALVSVMATLHCGHFWERLLVPAFVFFFKLLYPFALVESGRRAGAAGGCMLVEREALRTAGGFAALRGALIDDCTLAAKLKRRGYRLSLSMSGSAFSLREYAGLAEFWSMVSRTAFTQLGYSAALLLATCIVMLAVFFGPPAALVLGPWRLAAGIGLVGFVLMCLAYRPVVRFYRLPTVWTATLPIAAALFLGMTLTSALNYWRGTRATWKERSYGASID
ncbi:MAG TPA: glycosyltransferase [Gammaproteobacteria bacterium]|nr:glycosyltransferase [Gammaproteobacteria bacterium]